MGATTTIEWADATLNLVSGCSKLSPGCAHCYAEKLTRRWHPESPRWIEANAAEVVTLHPERLTEPMRWKQPKRIFVCSMGDLFHEQVPEWFLWLTLRMIRETPRHTYLILTKRPDRMAFVLGEHAFRHGVLPNLWAGTSIENQPMAEQRIPALLNTAAAVRFLSIEPLLGALGLRDLRYPRKGPDPVCIDVLGGEWAPDFPPPLRNTVDWVIVGGESGGPERRRLVERCGIGLYDVCSECNDTGWRPKPQALEWVRSLRDQCTAAGVPFFFKGWGGATFKTGGRLLDGREWNEFPQEVTHAN